MPGEGFRTERDDRDKGNRSLTFPFTVPLIVVNLILIMYELVLG